MKIIANVEIKSAFVFMLLLYAFIFTIQTSSIYKNKNNFKIKKKYNI